jgi:hypothetical protein
LAKDRLEAKGAWKAMHWLASNYQWLVAVVLMPIVLLLLKQWADSRNKTTNAAPQATPKTQDSQVSNAPEAVPARNEPNVRPILKIEAIKIGKIALQGDIWTNSPGSHSREPLFRALLADISNVPTELEKTKTVKLKAAIRMEYGGQTRTFTPLPWLEEYTNTVFLEAAATKVVVLAIGRDIQFGEWHFVLNHRKDYNTWAVPSAMDWTNLAPIPSAPFEILLIDVSGGILATSFKYLWTLDAELGYPVLKPPNLAAAR